MPIPFDVESDIVMTLSTACTFLPAKNEIPDPRTTTVVRSNELLLHVEQVGSAGEKRMKSLLSIPKITRIERRSFALPMLFACLLLAATPAAQGQLTNVDDATAVPIEGAGHDYIKALSDTVNPANGSVSLRINLPIPSNFQSSRHYDPASPSPTTQAA